jgi:hypothetical protein
MATPSSDMGFRPARRILPLGFTLGVVLLTPLVWYLLSRDGVGSGDVIVYVFATVSVVLAYLVFVLLFLWGAEYADEESDPDAD